MGPDNPWSPNWRPDPSGDRLRMIRAARRGGVLAGLFYLLVGSSILLVSALPDAVVLLALVVGLPGVALLGAGLAPSALGSRTEAAITGIAFAVGAPVAAVTSIVIGGLFVGLVARASTQFDGDLAGTILRAGVTTAIGVAPAIALAAAAWVVLVRRLDDPLPAAPASPDDRP
jgi:hypothetical protein